MLTGTSLGPYLVLAKLAEGGMGQVCKARDTRLDRTVAVKVLPEAFAKDPDRLGRFEREARAGSPPPTTRVSSIATSSPRTCSCSPTGR